MNYKKQGLIYQFFAILSGFLSFRYSEFTGSNANLFALTLFVLTCIFYYGGWLYPSSGTVITALVMGLPLAVFLLLFYPDREFRTESGILPFLMLTIVISTWIMGYVLFKRRKKLHQLLPKVINPPGSQRLW